MPNDVKLRGRVYTPDYIVNGILDLLGYKNEAILERHIMDNSCGDGAFLCEVVRRYCATAIVAGKNKTELKTHLETFIHGIELDANEARLCVKNLEAVAKEFEISNINWDIKIGDAMTAMVESSMDFVVGNPPYVRVHNLKKNYASVKNLTFTKSGMTDLFIAFFELGLRALKPSGKLGYITPSSYFHSLAGRTMRGEFVAKNLLEKVVPLSHFQAFSATTYTAITILNKAKNNHSTELFSFDAVQKMPVFEESLLSSDFFISKNFYFAKKSELKFLKIILENNKKSKVCVKNGYATLCDGVFVRETPSKFSIGVVKASTAQKKFIIYPYDKDGELLKEATIAQDDETYKHLLENKDLLERRDLRAESVAFSSWYGFGRSQAIKDTYKDKIAINTLLRNENDLKLTKAPAGVGVYSGLYVVYDSKNNPIDDKGLEARVVENALKSREFATYVAMLGKYKSGGYYAFSSKDVQAFLDYKLTQMEEG